MNQRKWNVFRLMVVMSWLAGLLLIHSPRAAYACSCVMPGTPTEELESSAAVFAGEVTSVQTKPTGGRLPVTVTFKVSEVWKGDIQGQASIHTGMGDADCGFEFVTGREYLVYARTIDGVLSSGICYRTKLLIHADAELAELGAGTVPTPPAPSNIHPLLPLGAGVLIAVALIGGVMLLMRRWERKSAEAEPPI